MGIAQRWEDTDREDYVARRCQQTGDEFRLRFGLTVEIIDEMMKGVAGNETLRGVLAMPDSNQVLWSVDIIRADIRKGTLCQP